MDIRQAVVSGLRWSAVSKFGSQLISWASTLIVMRILDPSDYGLLAMAVVFVEFCRLVNEMGLGAAIIQAKTLTDDALRQAFSIILFINLFLFIVLTAAAQPISAFFEEERLIAIVPVLAAQFIIIPFSIIPISMLTREMNFKAQSIAVVIGELLRSFVTLGMALSGFAYWSLIIGGLVGTLARTIGLNAYFPYFRTPVFNFRGFSPLAKFGGLASLNRVLWYFYSRIDITIVGKMLGKVALGYYSVAMHIASLPMDKVAGIINQVALPAYSRIQDNKQQVASYTLKASRAMALIAFPVFLGISSIAPEFVQVILGDKWLPGILPLQLLSLVVPLRLLSSSLAPAVNGMGRPDINVKTLAVACIIMPAAFLIGVKWELTGVSLAWVIGYGLWFLYMLSRALPILGLTPLQYLRSLAGPALFSGVMFGMVYLTRYVVVQWGVTSVSLLISLVAVGMVVYGLSMFLCCRNTCREAIDLVYRK